jgi:hypothetical protein
MADGLALWFPTHCEMKLRNGWGTRSLIFYGSATLLACTQKL